VEVDFAPPVFVPAGEPVELLDGAALDDGPPGPCCGTLLAFLSPHCTETQALSFCRLLPAAALQSMIHWPQMKEGSMLAKLVKFGWLPSVQMQEKVRLSASHEFWVADPPQANGQLPRWPMHQLFRVSMGTELGSILSGPEVEKVPFCAVARPQRAAAARRRVE